MCTRRRSDQGWSREDGCATVTQDARPRGGAHDAHRRSRSAREVVSRQGSRSPGRASMATPAKVLSERDAGGARPATPMVHTRACQFGRNDVPAAVRRARLPAQNAARGITDVVHDAVAVRRTGRAATLGASRITVALESAGLCDTARRQCGRGSAEQNEKTPGMPHAEMITRSRDRVDAPSAAPASPGRRRTRMRRTIGTVIVFHG